MRILSKAIKNVAILTLMVILIMPAAVHAHTLELLGAETTHAAGGGCHDADNGTDQGTNDDHQLDVRCCELDTPYVLPFFQSLVTPAVTGKLTLPFSSRQRDGYSRRIYKPPR